MIKSMKVAVRFLIVMMIVLGGIYPIFVTGISALFLPAQASGSLLEVDGHVVGSAQLGQNFAGNQYLHPRPSMAGEAGYDPLVSGGSNTAASTQKEKDIMLQRAAEFRKVNGLSAKIEIPMEMLTASGSGLDPDISPEAAKLQVKRIATARGVTQKKVLDLIDRHTDKPLLGLIGTSTVNVLEFNIALDRLD